MGTRLVLSICDSSWLCVFTTRAVSGPECWNNTKCTNGTSQSLLHWNITLNSMRCCCCTHCDSPRCNRGPADAAMTLLRNSRLASMLHDLEHSAIATHPTRHQPAHLGDIAEQELVLGHHYEVIDVSTRHPRRLQAYVILHGAIAASGSRTHESCKK